MISVKALHTEVRRSINLINSDWLKGINSVDLDGYLNKAKDYILHNYTRLAESSKEFENHLRELEILDKPLVIKNKTNNYILANLPVDYYDYLDVSIIGKKEIKIGDSVSTCTDNIWNIRYFQKDDVSLHDPNYAPSWEWRSGLYNFNREGLVFYHENKYDVQEVKMTYIKNIPDIAAPSLTPTKSYVKADGVAITKDVDLEISSTMLWRKICEVAEFYIKKDNNQNYPGTIDSIMFNERTAIN